MMGRRDVINSNTEGLSWRSQTLEKDAGTGEQCAHSGGTEADGSRERPSRVYTDVISQEHMTVY